MSKPNNKEGIRFEKQAIYRIRVQGNLDDSFADCLGGISIMTTLGIDDG